MNSATIIHPPFTDKSAQLKVKIAEDAWNSRRPERIVLGYSEDSVWRNRSEFIKGHKEIIVFLKRKWSQELNYRLAKELWAFSGNRIGVRFQYEYQDKNKQWHRAYGNENWEFNENGLMSRREASINDVAISIKERRFHWNLDKPRPNDAPGCELPSESPLIVQNTNG